MAQFPSLSASVLEVVEYFKTIGLVSDGLGQKLAPLGLLYVIDWLLQLINQRLLKPVLLLLIREVAII